MKNICWLTVMFFVITHSIFSQDMVKGILSNEKNAELDKKYKKYEIFEIDHRKLKSNALSGKKFSLVLGEKKFDIQLEKVNLLSPSYYATKSVNNIIVLDEQNYQGSTFKGFWGDNKHNHVRLTIENNFINGFLQDGNDFYQVSLLDKKNVNGSNKYVFVKSKDIYEGEEEERFCDHSSHSKHNSIINEVEKSISLNSEALARPLNTDYYLEIATEADDELYSIHGQNTNLYIQSILNQAEQFYVDSFNLHFVLTFQNVFETEDPYNGDPGTFFDEWKKSSTNNIRRDVAIYFSGEDTFGVLGTISETFCTPNKKSHIMVEMSQWNNLQNIVLLQHEIGHSLSEDDFRGPPFDGSVCERELRNDHLMCSNIQWKADPIWLLPETKQKMELYLLQNNSCLANDFCNEDKTISNKTVISYLRYGGYRKIETSGNVIVDQTLVPIIITVAPGVTQVIGTKTVYGHLELNSWNGVELNPGFEVRSGCQLTIRNNPCFEIN